MDDTLHVQSANTNQTKTSAPAPYPAAVKTWLEALPLTNITLSVRRIIHTLRKLQTVAHKLNPNDWYEILELLHPKAEYFATQLRQKYLIDSAPHTQKEKQRCILLAHLLQRVIANSYSEMAKPNKLTYKNRGIVAMSIYRAISYLTQILVGSYELYLQPPPYAWRQLHALYYYAEKNYFDDYLLRDTNALFKVDTTTISNAYKRALLLSTVNPYQLSRIDIEKLFTALSTWSDKTHLYREQQSSALYIIDLEGMEAPNYAVFTHLNSDPNKIRYLDTSSLSTYIETSFQNASPNSPNIQFTKDNISLNKALLQALVQNWRHRRIRLTERKKQKGELEVCVGLSATHYYLTQANDPAGSFGTTLTPLPSFKQKPTHEHAPEITITEKPNKFQQRSYIKNASANLTKELRKQYTTPLGNSRKNKNTLKKTLPPQQNIQLWKILNISQHGYCLSPILTALPTVQPGVIIGIQTNDSHSRKTKWQIFAIRWVQFDSKKSFQVGAQLLSANADPIVLEGNRQLHQLRGLLLEDPANSNKIKTLIIPAIPYKAGDIIKISSKKNQYLVKLLEQLGMNHSYCHFTYSLLTTGNLRRWGHTF